MPTLTLAPDSRDLLSVQVAQNGTFIHGLCTDQGLTIALAYVLIEQCDIAIHLRVELGDSRNTLTLARRDDNAERVALFIEELANGVSPVSVPTIDEIEWVSAREILQRDAVRLGQGTFHLPDDQDLDLALVLHPATTDPLRSVFYFEMHGRGVTLPVLLPKDREQAYRLLADCVPELMANYRSWAA